MSEKVLIILIVVLLIFILFFGAKKLPELARGIGQSANELKKGFREGADEPKEKPSDADKKL